MRGFHEKLARVLFILIDELSIVSSTLGAVFFVFFFVVVSSGFCLPFSTSGFVLFHSVFVHFSLSFSPALDSFLVVVFFALSSHFLFFSTGFSSFDFSL